MPLHVSSTMCSSSLVDLYDVIFKNNIFSTHAVRIFVNEISSPTYTKLIFVTYHVIYYVVFSSDTVSNLTMAIRAETCNWDICIWQYSCVKTNTLAYLFTFGITCVFYHVSRKIPYVKLLLLFFCWLLIWTYMSYLLYWVNLL